jgi:hypothetical protein
MSQVWSPRAPTARCEICCSRPIRLGRITEVDWLPMTLDGSVRVATLVDWRNAVRRAGTTSNVIVVNLDEGMRRSARYPTITSVQEIIRWTEANSAIPVLRLTLSNVEDGCMAGVGVSPYEQALMAGKIAMALSSKRLPAGSLKIEESAQFVVALREPAIRRRGFQAPAIYHAFASATEQDIECDGAL